MPSGYTRAGPRRRPARRRRGAPAPPPRPWPWRSTRPPRRFPRSCGPALRCVTCRTLTSVFDRLRSISFCRFLTLRQSCSCAALKIRCRSRRTCSSQIRQSMASQAGHTPSGPFAVTASTVVSVSMASNLPFGSGGSDRIASKAHLPTSAPFGPGSSPVSGQLCGTPGGGTGRAAPVSCCLSAHRHSLLGHPVPARDLGLRYAPAYRQRLAAPRTLTGFPRSACARLRPGWAPPRPRGQRCSHGRRNLSGRRLPFLQRPGPAPRYSFHLPGLLGNEASARVHSRSPVRSSPRLRPRMERARSGFFP